MCVKEKERERDGGGGEGERREKHSNKIAWSHTDRIQLNGNLATKGMHNHHTSQHTVECRKIVVKVIHLSLGLWCAIVGICNRSCEGF